MHLHRWWRDGIYLRCRCGAMRAAEDHALRWVQIAIACLVALLAYALTSGR